MKRVIVLILIQIYLFNQLEAESLKIDNAFKLSVVKLDYYQITYYEVFRNFYKTHRQFKSFSEWKMDLKKKISFIDDCYKKGKKAIDKEKLEMLENQMMCQENSYLDVFLVLKYVDTIKKTLVGKAIQVLNSDRVFYTGMGYSEIEINESRLKEIALKKGLKNLIVVLQDIVNKSNSIKIIYNESYIEMNKDDLLDLIIKVKLDELWEEYEKKMRYVLLDMDIMKWSVNSLLSDDLNNICQYNHNDKIISMTGADIKRLYNGIWIKPKLGEDNIEQVIKLCCMFDFKKKEASYYGLYDSDRFKYDEKYFIDNENYNDFKREFFFNVNPSYYTLAEYYSKNKRYHNNNFIISIYKDTNLISLNMKYEKLKENYIDTLSSIKLKWNNELFHFETMKYINSLKTNEISSPYRIGDTCYLFVKHEENNIEPYSFEEIKEFVKNDYLEKKFHEHINQLYLSKLKKNPNCFRFLDTLSQEKCLLESKNLFMYLR